MWDLGVPKYFMGIEIARSKARITLSQRTYAMELLSNAGLLGCRLVATPMEPNTKLSNLDGYLLLDPAPYRRHVGRLIFLTITQLDLSFVVNKLS